MNQKLLETVADIAYHAGYDKHYSGDSRVDIMNFIWWAKEFESIHKDTDWESIDYMLTIDAYAKDKLEKETIYLQEMSEYNKTIVVPL